MVKTLQVSRRERRSSYTQRTKQLLREIYFLPGVLNLFIDETGLLVVKLSSDTIYKRVYLFFLSKLRIYEVGVSDLDKDLPRMSLPPRLKDLSVKMNTR